MKNNIFTIMIVVSIVFLLIFTGLYSVYVYRPELLGIANPIDSMKVIGKEILSPAELEVKLVSHQRDSLLKYVNKITDSLIKLNGINDQVKHDIENIKKKFNDQDKQISQHLDSLVKSNYTLFAQIYDKAGAKEVAKILSELDERDAAFILKTMKPKNAAKVLDEMNPVQAAAILVLGANQR